MKKYFFTDVDGTLTDGRIIIGNDGELAKCFNAKDGYALNELLPQNGIIPVILTGRQSKIVEIRADELNITHVYQGIKDKLDFLNSFTKEHNITFQEMAFIGDDVNDLECIKACGIGGCPSDSVKEVQDAADYISSKPGGMGAVRDFAEYVIESTK